MNMLTTNPAAAGVSAHQTSADRVRDAEERRVARAVRDERRGAARALRHGTTARPLSGLTFRFLRPAH